MRLWFLRHAEIEAPLAGAFVGKSDVALSPLGRHQAQAVAQFLAEAPVDAIVSSPLRRALDTAAPLAKQLGQKLVVRDAWREMDFGRWEGLHWAEIERRDPAGAKLWLADPATVPTPGGETADAFCARVQQALEGLRAEFAGRSLVLSGHAGTSRAILAQVLGRAYMDCFVFAQDFGCVNAAAWTDEGYGQIALLNFVPGPPSAVRDTPGPG